MTVALLKKTRFHIFGRNLESAITNQKILSFFFVEQQIYFRAISFGLVLFVAQFYKFQTEDFRFLVIIRNRSKITNAESETTFDLLFERLFWFNTEKYDFR